MSNALFSCVLFPVVCALTCYSQEEIAAAVGVTKETISAQIEVCQILEDFPNSDKLAALHQDADFTPPLYNVWTVTPYGCG
jgi:hypothetical protein